MPRVDAISFRISETLGVCQLSLRRRSIYAEFAASRRSSRTDEARLALAKRERRRQTDVRTSGRRH